MKQLNSTAEDLRQIFGAAIPVRFIAEALVSFDAEAQAEAVRCVMEKKNFDRVGVRRDGIVCGYVLRSSLVDGPLKEYVRAFEEEQIVDDTSSIADVIRILPRQEAIFVRVLGQVGGIVTRGDLRKAPVRMWMFGLVSLLEMQMLRIIRERWPDETWRRLLSDKRISDAEELYSQLRGRNEALELVDCLQLCDKRDIILSSDDLRRRLHLVSKTKGKEMFEDIEDFRDDLAHAGDFLADRRLNLVQMIGQIECTLEAAEKISFRDEMCISAQASD